MTVEAVIGYHEHSKHHVRRYAASPGRLDWSTEPDPFRRYEGAPALELPLPADGLETPWGDLLRPGAVAPRRLDRESLGLFFELALALSAWKEFRGSRWALRCNPSSGNLHPTEGYVIVPSSPGVPAGLYHYASREHVLERRSSLSGETRLAALLPAGGFLAGLSSIHWREAWKYGVRAFRYCQQDAGHAVAAIGYAAAALGWTARLLTGPGDADVAATLGLDRDDDFARLAAPDREHPDALLVVAPGGTEIDAAAERLGGALDELVALVRGGTWAGLANPLSHDHVAWPAIEEVAAATRKPRGAERRAQGGSDLQAARPGSGEPAARLIRRRRSAVEMDGVTAIDAGAFYTILDRTLPRAGVPPCDAIPWSPRIHAGIFVHRVRGLAPGLYAFERDPRVHDELRAALRPEFAWERPAGCPDHIRLFLLVAGDTRSSARLVSCHQGIAADGAFSLGMIAEFRRGLAEGPWWYRWLHWEAGVVGQALYLEAEAAGVRSTGIGCFFDDAFHGVLGLQGDAFQDVYHFTVGAPLEDARLTTLAPYPDRPR